MVWQKGKSGNPGGRPRGSKMVRELARQHGPDAIKALAHVMHHGEPRDRIVAANSLLDRGFGKPHTEVQIREIEKHEIAAMTTEDLKKEYARIVATMEAEAVH